MNNSLYQLGANYLQALEGLTDPERDFSPEVIKDTLEGLAGELEDKAVNVAKYIRNLEATAEAIKAAETEMAKRRKTLEAQVAWLKNYIKVNMEITGITKIECPYFKLSLAKNPASVDVFDEAAIPAQYKRTETVTVTDKAAIKTALSSGCVIPGVQLVNGMRLVIK